MKQRPALTESAQGLRLAVRVTTRASSNALEAAREGQLRVRVSAAPHDGQANLAVIRLLAEVLRVSPSRLEIVGGAASRSKQILLRGVERKDLPPAFLALLSEQ